MPKRSKPQDAATRELVSTRHFHAPRAAVYRAFSDPAILARWWGPRGSTNTFHEFDLRTGGTWRFTMRAADGHEYAMHKTFTDVAPPERLVLRHEQESHSFTMSIRLFEEDGGTRMEWHMLFDAPEQLGGIRDLLVTANEENFDRLAAELGALS